MKDNFWGEGYKETFVSIQKLINGMMSDSVSEHLAKEELVKDDLYQLLAKEYGITAG